jgi:hypothetical protein
VRTDAIQVFALCLHSRPFLEGEAERPAELFGLNSSFTPVHAVSFERAGASSRDGAIADRVAPWLRRLKSDDVMPLRPFLSNCPMHHLNETGKQWGVISDGNRGLELWQPHWKTRVAGCDDPAPFKVIYTASRINRWSLPPLRDLQSCLPEFAVSLNEMAAFTESFGDNPTKYAVRRLVQLHSGQKLETNGFDDVIPTWLDHGIKPQAASAIRAIGFLTGTPFIRIAPENKPDIEKITADLWKASMAILEAVCSAADVPLKQSA